MQDWRIRAECALNTSTLAFKLFTSLLHLQLLCWNSNCNALLKRNLWSCRNPTKSFLCANAVLTHNQITYKWKYMNTEQPNTIDPAVITTSVSVLGYTTAALEHWVACKVKSFSVLFHTVPSSLLILWIIIMKSFYSFAVSNPGMQLSKYRHKLKPYVNLNGRHLVVIKMVETHTLDCAHIEHQRGNRTVSNQVYKQL